MSKSGMSSSWRISPEMDESSHDKWWDLTKSHIRWIRVGIKTYDNSSTYVGLRLFKPDFQTGEWHRQSHFSFTIEELTAFVALMGFGEKNAAEAAGIRIGSQQEFNKAIEASILGEAATSEAGGPSVTSFGKKTNNKRAVSKGAANQVKKRGCNTVALNNTRSDNLVEVHQTEMADSCVRMIEGPPAAMDVSGVEEDGDDDVFLN